MGTSEIYRAVLAVDAVTDALVVDVEGWMPLFVVLQEGAELSDDLVGEIRTRIVTLGFQSDERLFIAFYRKLQQGLPEGTGIVLRGSAEHDPSPSNNACRKTRLTAAGACHSHSGTALSAERWPTISQRRLSFSAVTL